jgi:hypothetical protein
MAQKRSTIICGSSAFFAIFLLTIPAALAQAPVTPLFLPVVTHSSDGIGPISMAVTDVNQDGIPDLVILNHCPIEVSCTGIGANAVTVQLGNGDGTFRGGMMFDSGGFGVGGVAVGDMNGDGKMDIVVSNWCGSDSSCQTHSATVGVLLGRGDGTFQPAVVSDSGSSSPQSMAIGDLNGDGVLDVVIGNCDVSGVCFTGSGFIAVLLGKGDGTLRPAVVYDSGGQNAEGLSIADVNGDGIPDVVVANCAAANGPGSCPGEGVVGVLLGKGDGTFGPAVTYNSGVYTTRSSSVADVNGDGKIDVLVAAECGFGVCGNGGEGGIGILLGNGDGTFQPPLIYGSGACDANSVAASDLNGDGKPDLLVANQASVCGGPRGAMSVLLGNGDGTFQSATSYDSGGFGNIAAVAADVNSDGKPDAIVADVCVSADNCSNGLIGVLLNNTPFCTTPPVITVSTTPTGLWPPNGNMVPVTVSGTMTDTGCTVTSAAYAVKDEYGEVQPSGSVTLGAGGAYSFTVLLQALRLGTDLDGRLYTITVSASNNASKTRSQAGSVIVPHDQGH